jgi:ABC-2 type transport system permease protein
LLIVVAAVDSLLGTTLGLLASAFAHSEFQAVQFMPAFVLPQFLLCGLLTPRDSLPGVLSAVSDVLPLSYAVDGMRTLSGVDGSASITSDVLWDLLIVAGFVVVAVVLGSATLRRRTP